MNSVPIYFAIVSFAFSIGLLWLVRRADSRGLGRNQALDLALVIMASGFIGARLTHVLFEEPAYYAENPLRVFEVWYGGFVWYGGALVAGLSGWVFARHRKFDLPVWLDLFAPILALGYAIGRLACLLTGCCYGDFCNLIEGVTFRYPTQAFAVFWESGVLLLLLHFERSRRTAQASHRTPDWFRNPGRLFSLWLVLHATGRIVMEWFRADPRGPNPMGLSLSTWISLGLLAVVAFVEARRSCLSPG